MLNPDHVPPQKSVLERALSLATDVRAGEGVTAMLLTINGFLLLSAYYTIRPIRSGLLLPVQIPLPGGGVMPGPEIQQYSGAILAALFLVIVPLYTAFASRVNRIRLINAVTMFFVVTLIGFFFVGQMQAYPTIVAVAFFLWIGVFSLMVIAQFWSFANDLYSPEQGKRLFAVVGFGGSVGAIAGSVVNTTSISLVGILPTMLVASAQLLLALGLTNLIHVREQRRPKAVAAKKEEQPLGGSGGFKLVLGQRYLLLIGLLTLIVNFVNTNGNYILNETLARMARETIAAGNSGQAELITSAMAGVDFWQNVLSMAIQLFLVSRIFKYLGIGGALFILPVIALGSYGLFAFAPVLAFIRLAKITENATDYSVQNTVRRALFLPTSREAKYKALQAVETFFWRAGDMVSGIATIVIVRWLELSVRTFALVNLAIVIVWLLLAASLAKENRRLMAEAESVAA